LLLIVGYNGFAVNTELILFEQPLNEHIRICLRLEHLFKQAEYHLQNDSEWDSRTALTAIIDILNVIDRPDLKNKLGKALNQFAANLIQLEQLPNVDVQKLRQTLDTLDCTIDSLHSNQGKIGQELRENEFIVSIQQRLTTPAGTCSFSTPAYHLWLKQPMQSRKNQLLHWYGQFSQLQTITHLLLKLTRDSTALKTKIANCGFYQTNLDPTIPFQIIRIQLPAAMQLYPEISVGRHRLTIHFFELNANGKSPQTKLDVQFELACCKV
jgi:cell division protein ZapD